MKKKYIVIFILMLVLITGCGKKDNTELAKQLSKLTLTGDLVTKKVYYHNVAEYDGSKINTILRIFGIEKKAWLEYTGIVELSIDLTQVKITNNKDVIHVVIPKTKVHRPMAQDDVKVYTGKGDLLNLSKVDSSEATEAMAFAQKEMEKNVQNDTQLLRMAQLRAKSIIEEKINQFADASEYDYHIEWEYEDNKQA